MKGFFSRVISSLKLNGRDWAVFLLALLLAFSIWIIHNLALKYNKNLTVSVVAITDIDGHADRSINECQLTAKCRATGYKLLLHTFRTGKAPIEVNLPSHAFRHTYGDEYYLLSSDLMQYSNKIFDSGISVENFRTDTLFYRFPIENYVKLPVKPVILLGCRDQYMLDGKINIKPDSVFVYGEPFLLNQLEYVSTERITHFDISSDIFGTISLEPIKGVRVSEKAVNYSIGVVRYAEIQTISQINAENVPVGKALVPYPSVAKVKVKYEFPPVVGFNDDIRLAVNYDDFQESISGKCRIDILGEKVGIIDYEIDPPYAECILEDE